MRVLVDRLWPRGISKQKAALDAWEKEIAPSPELRQWFDHRADRFEEFRRRYKAELRENPAWREFHTSLGRRPVTLVYGAKDPRINHAAILAEILKRRS